MTDDDEGQDGAQNKGDAPASSSPAPPPTAQPQAAPDPALALLVTPDGPEPDAPPIDLDALPRGTAIATYVLLGRMGASGLGPVYAAFDTHADRKVALRLIPVPTNPEEDTPDPRADLIASLGPVARLQHPCIVPVLQVSRWTGGVLVASEFFEGIELEAWVAARDEPFPWREVLRAFRQAGRALAAAHRSAVIHRDFRPDNVMMGRDGQVRVLDFGLPELRQYDGAEGERVAALRAALDLPPAPDPPHPHVIVGTPEYAAPECLAGQEADAQSDQFSFCVALYEALYGERPFAGTDPDTLAGEMADRRVRPAPPNTSVPLWLRTALLRGLALRKAERWPSMEALVRELDRDPAASRRRWTRGLGLLGVLAVAAVAVFWQVERAKANCEVGQEHLAGLWDQDRRATLQNVFAGLGREWSAEQWHAVSDEVDAWVDSWSKLRGEACVVTRIRGESSEQLYQQRLACLDDRLSELGGLLGAVGSFDAAGLAQAHLAAAALTSPRVCTRPAGLRESASAGATTPEQARELRSRLAHAWALLRTSQLATATAMATELERDIIQLRHPGLEAEILRLGASVAQAAGDRREAEAGFHRAGYRASRGELDYALAAAWIDLAELLAHIPGRETEAGRWLDYAENVSERIPDEQSKWRVAMIRGDIAARTKPASDALARYHEALAELDKIDAPPWPRIEVFTKLGRLVVAQGDFQAAERYQGQALGLAAARLGSHHPDLVAPMLAIADAQARQHQFDRARGTWEQALALLNGAPEPGSATVRALLHIADRLRTDEQLDAALEYGQRAILLAERDDAGAHGLLGAALVDHARSLLALGREGAAIEPLTRATDVLAQQPRADAKGSAAAEDGTRGARLLAEARAMLARVLWRAPKTREQALRLAHLARNSTAAVPAEVEPWLAGIDDPKPKAKP